MQAITLGDADTFVRDPARVYLNTAARGLMPRSAAAACEAYLETRAGLAANGQSLDDVANGCKDKLAAAMGVESEGIAFVGSTSDACSVIYDLVDWRDGDNVVVVTDELEFPSVLIPAYRLREHGVSVRAVAPQSGLVSAASVAAQVDARTRLVFVSHVSFRTGARLPLEAIAQAVRAKADAWVAADISQSLGVVEVPAAICDFAISTAFKWTLGAHGVAVLYWNRNRVPDPRPVLTGWHAVTDDSLRPYTLHPDARRFEAGNLAYLPVFTLKAGLECLEAIGSAALERHVLELSGQLAAGLRDLGLPCLTPASSTERAGIVSWADRDCAKTAAMLSAAGIHVTGSSARVRASVHLYNHAGDVEHLLAAMRSS